MHQVLTAFMLPSYSEVMENKSDTSDSEGMFINSRLLKHNLKNDTTFHIQTDIGFAGKGKDKIRRNYSRIRRCYYRP